MEIAPSTLKPETLDRLIESFVMREGTDYGHRQYSLKEKVTMVKKQLYSGTAAIYYDEETESCNIAPK